jgi:FMN-dependent NADH-azoreductase
MRVLHIDCSVRNEWSVSRELSQLFVNSLKDKFNGIGIDYLDIANEPPNHLTSLMIRGNYTPPEDRTIEMKKELEESDALVDRMLEANLYVIGIPMYNFSIPSNFKAFIDNVVRIGRTFKVVGHSYEGVLTDKKVYIINTRGVDFNDALMTPMDQLVPYIKTVFGFMGITDMTFIDVHPVQFAAEQARAEAINRAKIEILEAVKSLNY